MVEMCLFSGSPSSCFLFSPPSSASTSLPFCAPVAVCVRGRVPPLFLTSGHGDSVIWCAGMGLRMSQVAGTHITVVYKRLTRRSFPGLSGLPHVLQGLWGQSAWHWTTPLSFSCLSYEVGIVLVHTLEVMGEVSELKVKCPGWYLVRAHVCV